MFPDALEIARNFTLPVVISRKASVGKCSSSIGACVVINKEGWIITACQSGTFLAHARIVRSLITSRGERK